MFNYRSDRMRELTAVLGLPDKPIKVDVPEDLVSHEQRLNRAKIQSITTMSRYNPEWTFPVAFPPASMANVLAEWIAKQGFKQCHIAGKRFPLCASLKH